MKYKNRERFRESRPRLYEKLNQITRRYQNGESIAEVRLEYDYICNMHCKHCCVSDAKTKRRKITVKDVKWIADNLDEMGIARFRLTGGEPLLFKEFDKIIEAVDPKRFYINIDTNGWFLDQKRAEHLKDIGVDRCNVSIDHKDFGIHDEFRGKKNASIRARLALLYAKNAGIEVGVTTTVDRERLYSLEFEMFLDMFTTMNIPVCIQFLKSVGSYKGHDTFIYKTDMQYEKLLEKKYNCFTHLTPAYGLNMGCIAVRGIFTITAYGDITPCPFIRKPIGNVFEEDLGDIIKRGLKHKWYGKHHDHCLLVSNKKFIEYYER